MYARVILLSPPWSELTYSLPPDFPISFWREGMRAAVPLGAGAPRCGIIQAISAEAELPQGVNCKALLWPLETEPLLNGDLLALSRELALRQGLEPGAVFGHALPAPLRSTAIRLKWRGASLNLKAIAALDSGGRKALAAAMLSGEAIIIPSRQTDSEICSLLVDPPWPLRPAAKRRIELLDYIFERGRVSRREILELGAWAGKALTELQKAGYVGASAEMVGEVPQLMPPPAPAFELDAEQKLALGDLIAALDSNKPACRLLHGVTGSGKTAVYLELIRHCVEHGKSALLLAPEVALAHKLYRDASLALPDLSLYLYHGYQASGTRENTFRVLAAKKEPFVLVGTRCALFLPVANPGCVIMDEEHDASFKQEENFHYHAKEVAWFRMRKAGGLLLLGSATPDIRTFYGVQSGRLPILTMKSRVGGGALPPIGLVNIGARPGVAAAGSLGADGAGLSLLAPESEDALHECQARGEQAVILLNRRGYAPMIYCLDCAKTIRCPQCEIGLAFHKSRQKLVCHYCGYSIPYPAPCPVCHKMNFLTIGEGTERLAERLEALAGVPILRLDRDSARRPGAGEEILAAFGRHESPFLVGTQMLSKGHHFPDVTLVVVADGDIGLNLPDYRAAERTFQLLVQAAGRAGRGTKAGRVLIQTRDPGHYCWNYVRTYDYEGFYAEELARRKKNLYPPFTRLALLRISHDATDGAGTEAINELRACLVERARERGIRLLGPVPSPLAMIRGHKRFQALIKTEDWIEARGMYFYALSLKAAARLRISLDLDPVNML